MKTIFKNDNIKLRGSKGGASVHDAIPRRNTRPAPDPPAPQNQILARDNPPPPAAPTGKQQDRELFRLKNVFPFDLFPDEIIIQEHKVTVAIKEFFFSGYIRSLDIADIAEATFMASIFFATIRITTKTYTYNETKILFLKKDEARKASMLIEGLIAMAQDNVDTSKLTLEQLVERVERFGDAKAKHL